MAWRLARMRNISWDAIDHVRALGLPHYIPEGGSGLVCYVAMRAGHEPQLPAPVDDVSSRLKTPMADNARSLVPMDMRVLEFRLV
jgi:hypothetical protein